MKRGTIAFLGSTTLVVMAQSCMSAGDHRAVKDRSLQAVDKHRFDGASQGRVVARGETGTSPREKPLRVLLSDAAAFYRKGDLSLSMALFRAVISRVPSEDLVYGWIKDGNDETVMSIIKRKEKNWRRIGSELLTLARAGGFVPDSDYFELVVRYGAYGIRHMVSALNEPPNAGRTFAMNLIRSVGTRAVPALVAALSSEGEKFRSLRIASATLLGEIGGIRAIPALLCLINTPSEDGDVKAAAQAALAKIKSRGASLNTSDTLEAHWRLAKLYADLDPSVLPPPGEVPTVCWWDENAETVIVEAVPLAQFRWRMAIGQLLEILKADPDSDLGRVAKGYILSSQAGRRKSGSVPCPAKHTASSEAQMKTWWSELESKDAHRRWRAMLGLASMGSATVEFLGRQLLQEPPGHVVASLIQKLADDEPSIRMEAVEELLALGPGALPSIRSVALGALSVDVRDQINFVITTLSVPNRRRVRAIRLLGMLGTDEADLTLCKIRDCGFTGIERTEARKILGLPHRKFLISFLWEWETAQVPHTSRE